MQVRISYSYVSSNVHNVKSHPIEVRWTRQAGQMQCYELHCGEMVKCDKLPLQDLNLLQKIILIKKKIPSCAFFFLDAAVQYVYGRSDKGVAWHKSISERWKWTHRKRVRRQVDLL